MALPPGLPKFSLGWGVMDWVGKNLVHYAGDLIGKPWKYTPEQARFIVWFYAVDENGKYIYRRAVLERPKGSGKSPFLGTLAAAELLGPVQFSHWQGVYEGKSTKSRQWFPGAKPVGRAHPDALVHIAAISESQVDNSYSPLMQMLTLGPCANRYNLEVMNSKIVAPGKRRIERVTASPKSREGAPTTCVIADETWLWTPVEHGPELAEVISGNLAKTNGRLIESTNAYRPGERSIAEASHELHLEIEAGLTRATGLLYDSRRAECENIYDYDEFLAAATLAYGDAFWIDFERLYQEVLDPMNSEHELRRKYLNQLHSGDSKWIQTPKLKDIRKPQELKPKKDKFALGFVGAVRNGAAALVACRLKDSALFLVKIWEKPADARPEWEVPFHEVNVATRKWLDKLQPNCLLLANPQDWQDIIGRWAVDYEDTVEEFWVRSKLKMTDAVNQFEEAVYAGRISISETDRDLFRHIDNAYREETTNGYTIRKDKEHSKSYIQAAQAAVLALEAAKLSIEAGALIDAPSNLVFSF